MSLSNQQRAKLIDTIQETGVSVVGITARLIDQMEIRQYFPPDVLELLTEYISTFYVFKNDHVTGGKIYDGLSTYCTNTDTGEKIAAIGLCDAVILADDAEQQVFLILHELAHIVTGEGDDSELFHSYLNQLIIATNKHSGLNIQNDYFGYTG